MQMIVSDNQHAGFCGFSGGDDRYEDSIGGSERNSSCNARYAQSSILTFQRMLHPCDIARRESATTRRTATVVPSCQRHP